MKTTCLPLRSFLSALVLLAGGVGASESYAEETAFKAMMESSFQAVGIARLDRLLQDETQLACSHVRKDQLQITAALKSQIEKRNLQTVVLPKDLQYFGRWQEGEKIAQSGKGSTWSDKSDDVNGGGCYNCHQLDKKEISYGNMGPSLYNYGKLRGSSEAVVQYTWSKLYNAKAFNACSNMPRFGAFQLLTESQLRDLMALLFDPLSPVNQ
jgi:L-cysteine S-thiosulfotransferase